MWKGHSEMASGVGPGEPGAEFGAGRQPGGGGSLEFALLASGTRENTVLPLSAASIVAFCEGGLGALARDFKRGRGSLTKTAREQRPWPRRFAACRVKARTGANLRVHQRGRK